jgi:hypothetical protein
MIYHIGLSFRVDPIAIGCNVVENYEVLSEAKSIEIDLSILLRSSRDDDLL